MPTINKLKSKFKKINHYYFNQSSAYYNSKQWKNLRQSYIRQHPLCEKCLKYGRVTPAKDCHHIIPFLTGRTDNERWKLLLDDNNLMSVCKKCHIEIHNILHHNKL